jgi:hypothetical protein
MIISDNVHTTRLVANSPGLKNIRLTLVEIPNMTFDREVRVS